VKNSPPSKVFTNYFFNYPEKNEDGFINKSSNLGKNKLDGSDFIK